MPAAPSSASLGHDDLLAGQHRQHGMPLDRPRHPGHRPHLAAADRPTGTGPGRARRQSCSLRRPCRWPGGTQRRRSAAARPSGSLRSACSTRRVTDFARDRQRHVEAIGHCLSARWRVGPALAAACGLQLADRLARREQMPYQPCPRAQPRQPANRPSWALPCQIEAGYVATRITMSRLGDACQHLSVATHGDSKGPRRPCIPGNYRPCGRRKKRSPQSLHTPAFSEFPRRVERGHCLAV